MRWRAGCRHRTIAALSHPRQKPLQNRWCKYFVCCASVARRVAANNTCFWNSQFQVEQRRVAHAERRQSLFDSRSKDICVRPDLPFQVIVIPDLDYAITEIAQFAALLIVAGLTFRQIVIGAVAENADAR